MEGWVHLAQVSLAGAKILAFVDEQCVGSGVVDVFRQDVADAGYGEGMAGFGFSIYLEPWQDHRVLSIRLDGGHALIKQDGNCLVLRADLEAEHRLVGRDPQSLSWMLSRKWLTQKQFDGMRLLGLLGVYRLRLGLSSTELADTASLERIAAMARELLEMHILMNIDIETRADVSGENLKAIRSGLRHEFRLTSPVIGIWSPHIATLNLAEGSHLEAASNGSKGGIDYEFGEDHLLIVNLDCEMSFPRGSLDSGFTAFIPHRPSK